MPDYQFVTYELLDEGRVARILLNRPEARNAPVRADATRTIPLVLTQFIPLIMRMSI